MNLDKIINIIKEPVHGSQFYTKEMVIDLVNKLKDIYSKLEIDEETDIEKAILIIYNYVKANVGLRKEYFDAFCKRVDKFDTDEMVYRTAYGALIKGEAMCAGCAEAVRILLSLYDIKSYTLLSKLPGENKRLLHYVTVVEYNKDGQKKIQLLDPERQANCERKGLDYDRYKNNMIYISPEKSFTSNVIGETGVGMLADEYLKDENIPRVKGIEDIGKLIYKIKQKNELEMKNIER